MKTQPPIPQYLSPEVADFITKLLVKDPRQRLGGGEDDADELKRHSFFKVNIFHNFTIKNTSFMNKI